VTRVTYASLEPVAEFQYRCVPYGEPPVRRKLGRAAPAGGRLAYEVQYDPNDLPNLPL
jgi:hypothetical protein